MKAKIHSTAIVGKGANIGPRAEIGPYAVIGPHVTLGADCRIHSHAVIEGTTEIGENCEIFPGACLGMPPQDKKFKDFRSYLRIGSDNVIREHVTIHLGSKPESVTTVGDRNFLMIGAHVAHDCTIGNDVIITNGVTLAGHVTVEDRVVIGGLSGVHQFVRIGKFAMIGGMAKVVMDVPPFSLSDGNPARFCGSNGVGLKRAGYSAQDALAIKKSLKLLFASGLSLSNAVDRVSKEFKRHPEVDYLLSFVRRSRRGITRARPAAEG